VPIIKSAGMLHFGSELRVGGILRASSAPARICLMTECCAPPPLALPPRADRLPLTHEAFRLEWLTIGWMTVEAAVAIAAGVTAGSLVLIAFGLDTSLSWRRRACSYGACL
jgi:hypothetical protein